jgi:transposase-like protein
MISMSQKQEIILRFYREGQAKKRIARDLGVDVKTVRRYLSAYAEQLSELEGSTGEGTEALLSTLTEAPKYDASTRPKRRLTQEIQDKIDGYMASNVLKRNRGRHKQVMKKVDIHEALQKAGFQIGYTTVCNYIRHREQSGQEAFIRQHYDPGKVCEFDWGEVKLTIGGQERVFQLATFGPTCSTGRIRRAFKRPMRSFLLIFRGYTTSWFMTIPGW